MAMRARINRHIFEAVHIIYESNPEDGNLFRIGQVAFVAFGIGWKRRGSIYCDSVL
jgi:hypothetical protein